MRRSIQDNSSAFGAGQILRLAQSLVLDINRLNLDQVDGEFYWRCSRPDFASALEQARDQYLDEYIGRGTGKSFSQITDPLQNIFNLTDEQTVALVASYTPMSFRGYSISARFGEDSDVVEPIDNLLIKIPAPYMTGSHVEHLVRQMLLLDTEIEDSIVTNYDDQSIPQIMPSISLTVSKHRIENPAIYLSTAPRTSIHVSFDLIVKDLEGMDPEPLPFIGPIDRNTTQFPEIRPPYVEMVVWFPIPGPGILADLFDAVVRREYKWHHQLKGKKSRQNIDVAIRTWTVGLLTSRHLEVPMSFHEAMSAYEFATGLGPATQTKFQKDREVLIGRAPEAADFLYLRKPDSRKS